MTSDTMLTLSAAVAALRAGETTSVQLVREAIAAADALDGPVGMFIDRYTDRALAAARVLTPFLHGFVSMELSQAFRLGGGIDEAFETGLEAILSGLLTWRGSQ